MRIKNLKRITLNTIFVASMLLVSCQKDDVDYQYTGGDDNAIDYKELFFRGYINDTLVELNDDYPNIISSGSTYSDSNHIEPDSIIWSPFISFDFNVEDSIQGPFGNNDFLEIYFLKKVAMNALDSITGPVTRYIFKDYRNYYSVGEKPIISNLSNFGSEKQQIKMIYRDANRQTYFPITQASYFNVEYVSYKKKVNNYGQYFHEYKIAGKFTCLFTDIYTGLDTVAFRDVSFNGCLIQMD